MNFKQFKSETQSTKEAKIRSSGWIYRLERQLSVWLSWQLVRRCSGVTPNQVSVFNIGLVLGALGLTGLLAGKYAWAVVIVQLLLLGFSSVLDKVDGELARYYQKFTQAGIYYDLLYHFLYSNVFFLTLGFYFFTQNQSRWLLLGAISLAFLASLYRLLGKLRHHIRYKIQLEGHEGLVTDHRSSQPGLFRSVRFQYLVLGIYDQVWVWYFGLVGLSRWNFNLSMWLYSAYLIVSLGLVSYWLLVAFPQSSLFAREELEGEEKAFLKKD